jgi:hypothetical protein
MKELEGQTERAFETSASGLVAIHDAKRSVAIDTELRAGGRGMIQNIGRIHADLKSLRFRQLEGLRHAAVKTPGSPVLDSVLSQGSASSRSGILKKDLARSCVCQRTQVTDKAEVTVGSDVAPQVVSHGVRMVRQAAGRTLRILNLDERTGITEVCSTKLSLVSDRNSTPFDIASADVKWSDDIHLIPIP